MAWRSGWVRRKEFWEQAFRDTREEVASRTLLTLLAYARIVAVPVEMLIDDEIDLPSKLPLRRSRKVSR